MRAERVGAAIVGIGTTAFTREATESAWSMALRAIVNAIDDAGLAVTDVDGLVKYTIDSSASLDMVSASLGLGVLRFMAEAPNGGGGSATSVQLAKLAVENGAATVVVCFRAFTPFDINEGAKYNPSTLWARQAGMRDFWRAQGLSSMTTSYALACRRHMFEFGSDESALCEIVLASRQHAVTNSNALVRSLLTSDEYFAAPFVSEPLRTLDCFQLPSVGACAVVVTTRERAADLRHRPCTIMAAESASSAATPAYWESWPARPGPITATPAANLADRLFQVAGIGRDDIDVAEIYDCYSYTVLTQLEDYGFCKKGEGGEFVRDGRIRLGGELPVNTHGGHLSEAYIHGFNHIVEAVRQIRGQSSAQVRGAKTVIVTGGVPAPTSALILGA